jgi:hypothetical protein
MKMIIMLVRQGGKKGRRKANQRILLPDPATESRDGQGSGLRTVRGKGDTRFPCNHNNEPVDFH